MKKQKQGLHLVLHTSNILCACLGASFFVSVFSLLFLPNSILVKFILCILLALYLNYLIYKYAILRLNDSIVGLLRDDVGRWTILFKDHRELELLSLENYFLSNYLVVLRLRRHKTCTHVMLVKDMLSYQNWHYLKLILLHD